MNKNSLPLNWLKVAPSKGRWQGFCLILSFGLSFALMLSWQAQSADVDLSKIEKIPPEQAQQILMEMAQTLTPTPGVWVVLSPTLTNRYPELQAMGDRVLGVLLDDAAGSQAAARLSLKPDIQKVYYYGTPQEIELFRGNSTSLKLSDEQLIPQFFQEEDVLVLLEGIMAHLFPETPLPPEFKRILEASRSSGTLGVAASVTPGDSLELDRLKKLLQEKDSTVARLEGELKNFERSKEDFAAQLGELRQAKSRLEIQLGDVKRERDSLDAAVSRRDLARSDFERQLKNRIERLQEELRLARATPGSGGVSAVSGEESAQLREDLDRVQEELKKIQRQRDDLKTLLEDARQVKQRLEVKFSDLEKRNQELEGLAAGNQKTPSVAEKELQDQVTRLQEGLRQKEETLARTEASLKQASNTQGGEAVAQALRQRLEETEGQIRRLTLDLDRVGSQKADLEKKSLNLEMMLSGQQKNLGGKESSLKPEVSRLTQELELRDETLAQIQEQLVTTQRSSQEQQKELQAQIAKLQGELEQRDQALAQAQSDLVGELSLTRTQLHSKEDEARKLAVEKTDLEHRISELELSVSLRDTARLDSERELKTQMARLEDESVEREKLFGQAQAELTRSQATVQRFAQESYGGKEAVSGLAQELSTTQNQLRQREDEVRRLNLSMADLERRVGDLSQQLDGAAQQKQTLQEQLKDKAAFEQQLVAKDEEFKRAISQQTVVAAEVVQLREEWEKLRQMLDVSERKRLELASQLEEARAAQRRFESELLLAQSRRDQLSSSLADTQKARLEGREQLENRIRQLEQELGDREKVIGQLGAELTKTQITISRLSEESKGGQETLTQLGQDFASTRGQLRDSEVQVRNLTSKVDQQEQRLIDVNKILEETRTAKLELEKDFSQSRSALSESQKSRMDQEKLFQSRIEALETQLSAKSKVQSQLSQERDQLKEELDRTRSQLETVGIQRQELFVHNEASQQNQQLLEEKLKDLERKRADLESRSQARLQELQEELRNWEKEHGTLKAASTRSDANLARLTQETQGQKETLSQLTGELGKNREQLRQKEDQVRQLTLQVEKLQRQAQAAQEDQSRSLARNDESIGRLTQEVQSQKEALTRLTTELTGTRDQIRQKEEEIQKLTLEREQAEGQKIQAQQDRTRLTDQLQQKQKEAVDAKTRLESEFKMLQDHLGLLQKELLKEQQQRSLEAKSQQEVQLQAGTRWKAQVTQLEGQLRQRAEANGQTQADLTKTEAAITRLTQEVKGTKETIASLNQELSQTRELLRKKEEDARKLALQGEEAERRIAHLASEGVRRGEAVNQLQGRLEELTPQLETIQKSESRLQNELALSRAREAQFKADAAKTLQAKIDLEGQLKTLKTNRDALEKEWLEKGERLTSREKELTALLFSDRQEAQKAQQTIQRMAQELKTLQEGVEKERREKERLKSNVAGSTQVTAQLKEELELASRKLQEALEFRQQSQPKLEGQLEQLQKEKLGLEARIHEGQKSQEQSLAQLKQMETVNLNLERELGQLKKNLASQEEKSKKSQEIFLTRDEEIRQLGLSRQKDQESIKRLEQQLLNQKGLLAQAEMTIQDLRGSLGATQAELSKAQASMAQADRKVQGNEQATSWITQELSAVRAELDAKDQESKKMALEMEGLKQQLGQVKAAREHLSESQAQLQKAYDQTQEATRAAQQNQREVEDRFKQLDSTRTLTEIELSQLKQVLESKEEEIRRFSSSLSDAIKAATQLKAEVGQSQQSEVNVREQLNVAGRNATLQEKEIRNLRAETERLKEENSTQEESLREARALGSQLRQLQTERGALQRQITSLEIQGKRGEQDFREREQAFQIEKRALQSELRRLEQELTAAQEAQETRPSSASVLQSQLDRVLAEPLPTPSLPSQEISAPPAAASVELSPAISEILSAPGSSVQVYEVSSNLDFVVLSVEGIPSIESGSTLLLSDQGKPVAEVEVASIGPNRLAMAYLTRKLDEASVIRQGKFLTARVMEPSVSMTEQ